MTGGTKGGAQRASSLKPRCVREVNPETATHIYLSIPCDVAGATLEKQADHWLQGLRNTGGI
jgi:hypothetical protein